jgi:hypothetical protein
MYQFPSGQEFELYAPANRTRDPKFCFDNGPVIGLTVEEITTAGEELTAKGAQFVNLIEGLEDGTVQWSHSWGPDGQFYCLQQNDK